MRLVGLAAVAAFLVSACLPVFSPASDKHIRESVTKWLTQIEAQQAFVEGRRLAMHSPQARLNLLDQALVEYRYMADDPVTGAEFMDMYVGHLERATQTAPHDNRLKRLIITLVKDALADPELRPLLVEALRDAVPAQPVRTPVTPTPEPAESTEPG